MRYSIRTICRVPIRVAGSEGLHCKRERPLQLMMMIPSQWARAVNDNDDGDDGDVISSFLRKIIRTTMALMLCMLHACLLFFHTSFLKNVFAYVQRRSRSTLLYKNCLSTTFLRKKRLQSQVFFPGFFCQASS